jgi:nucleotide-binding universal stress UspA family protein
MEPIRREDVMFKTILWATDGSANADRALPVAKELAEAKGGRLVVAHCRELFSGRAAGFPVNADEDELLAKVREQAAELKSVGLDVQLEVATTTASHASHVIAEVAETEGADVIVVGTRGHGPFAGALLGSVTQQLLHIAPCPVLAIPTGEHSKGKDPTLTTTAAAG